MIVFNLVGSSPSGRFIFCVSRIFATKEIYLVEIELKIVHSTYYVRIRQVNTEKLCTLFFFGLKNITFGAASNVFLHFDTLSNDLQGRQINIIIHQ